MSKTPEEWKAYWKSKIVPMQYLVVQADPTMKPWKRHANSRFRGGPPPIYINVWSRHCIPNEPERDWTNLYELGDSYKGTIFTIKNGELVYVPSKYAWSKFPPWEFMEPDYVATWCKKSGLKTCIFTDARDLNRYMVSLGYPRIGGFSGTPGEDYFLPLEDSEPNYIQVDEKWGNDAKGQHCLLGRSLRKQ